MLTFVPFLCSFGATNSFNLAEFYREYIFSSEYLQFAYHSGTIYLKITNAYAYFAGRVVRDYSKYSKIVTDGMIDEST